MSMRLTRRRAAAAIAVLLGALGAGLIAPAAAQADLTGAVSIDVGGAGGTGFAADTYGTGGREDTKPAEAPSLPNFSRTVAHPIPADIWHTARVGDSRYVVPGLTPGATYEARLYFLDWYFTRPGQRTFDVAINGSTVLAGFDIIGAAITAGADGRNSFGVEKDFPVTVGADGTATFDFIRGAANQPQINAIALAPVNPAGISIDLGGAGGSGFVADVYGTGGSIDTKPAGTPSLPNFSRTVAHPIPADIWHTSRYGEFQYVVPGLTPGATYEARLYFLDWYFTRPGQRSFDVAINGTTVLNDFDIIGAAITAGADGRNSFGVEKAFPVTVGADGAVSIAFSRHSADQPQVNAIALVPLA
ncbi:malectin domain-containing carbohydrate-binding protein [Pseudosporangium ferrugineum]|uniref:Malectin (Di-glucose binding ER protein) n=1 Tax=Pseudosporangium ferrugineum TaxID=439699 RepID=A0A2T0S206_9ACTN|nr:malectin domain-containing carbohydrate-binding protein [Pseudosporangium ferrugineum]PRY27452.1 malectin (di-glucose binding ER protein) [Pseudosporangium ferrugineum]